MLDYLHLALLMMAVGVAGGYAGLLYLRYRHRSRHYLTEGQSLSHGIDVSGISGRVQRVRHDYVSELHSRPHAAGRRKDLLVVTRRAVGRLTYFRRRVSRDDVSTERDTESHCT